MAKVDFGGVIREACIEAFPEAQVGDYTIIHAGFALNLFSEEEAQETLDAAERDRRAERDWRRTIRGLRHAGAEDAITRANFATQRWSRG